MTQLGLAALGRPEYLKVGHPAAVDGRFDPAALEQRCHAVLDAAWDSGVRHFDVARSYGSTERSPVLHPVRSRARGLRSTLSDGGSVDRILVATQSRVGDRQHRAEVLTISPGKAPKPTEPLIR